MALCVSSQNAAYNPLHLYLLQPIISEDEEVVMCVEGLRQPPEKLAVLYPGCSQDSRVIVDVAESSLFHATVVRQLSDLNGVKLFGGYVNKIITIVQSYTCGGCEAGRDSCVTCSTDMDSHKHLKYRISLITSRGYSNCTYPWVTQYEGRNKTRVG